MPILDLLKFIISFPISLSVSTENTGWIPIQINMGSTGHVNNVKTNDA